MKKMKISNKWLLLIVFQFTLCNVLLMLNAQNFVSNNVIGISYVLFAIVELIILAKENLIFTPILAMILFEFSFGLYSFLLVREYEKFPLTMSLVINFCIFIWMLICCLNPFFYPNILNNQKFSLPPIRTFKMIIYPLFIIAVACTLLEWQKAGGIPILRADSETFRFKVSLSQITHIFSILNKIICMVIGIYLLAMGKHAISKERSLFLCAIVSELLMIGTAMRGEMIFAPATIFLFWILKKEIKMRYFVIAIVVVFFVIGIMPLLRMYSAYGNAYFDTLKSISVYPNLFYFTPLYQSFANGFRILAIDVTLIPKSIPYGYGAYGFLPYIPFLNLGSSFSVLQNEILNGGFYGALTGSYLQLLFADFGYIGCILGTMLLSILSNIAYKEMCIKKDLSTVSWYILTLYTSLWLFYATTFDETYIFYSLLILIVFRLKLRRN